MGSRTSRRAPARARPTRCGVAVDAFTAAGHPVLGTSTSNLATRTLEQEAGVRALNTTRLLADLDRGEALAPGTVLLVDEAGMVGTRKYQRLAEHVTAAGGKLIGVGDSRQLAEIEAGGAFRAISERFGAVELPGNRRQVDPEEIRALAALARRRRRRLRPLRSSNAAASPSPTTPPAPCAPNSPTGGRPHERHPSRSRCWSRCIAAASPSSTPTPTRSCATRGRLGDDEITVDDRSFAAGDRVVLLRNNKTLDVDNGDRGVILDRRRRPPCAHRRARRRPRSPATGLVPRRRLGRPRLRPDRPQAPEHHRRPHLRPGQRRPLPRGRLLRSPPAPATKPTSTSPPNPTSQTTNKRTDRPSRPRTPSPALPATSTTAAPKPSPQTNPRTRAPAR